MSSESKKLMESDLEIVDEICKKLGMSKDEVLAQINKEKQKKKKKTNKYMLDEKIQASLFDENIEALSFFSDIMLKPKNVEIMKEHPYSMLYYVRKLDEWRKDLCEFQYEDIDDEVVQLVVTLKHVLGTYIGYYYHKDGELFTDKSLSYYYHERICDDEEFNKDFDIAYLKLYTLDHKMIKLYNYLKENPKDKKGIESLEAIMEEERVSLMRKVKDKIEQGIIFDDNLLKVFANLIGYDDGIDIIHKVHSGSYSQNDIVGIINSRLGMRNDIKR